MKAKILFYFLMVFGVCTFAQIPTPAPSLPSKSDELLQEPKTKDLHFCCPKCNYCNAIPGNCPVDKTLLLKEGTYYCTVCLTTSDVSAKCPKCGKSMKKMEIPTKQASGKPVKTEAK